MSLGEDLSARLRTARDRSRQLRADTAQVAADIAVTEDRVADVYETMAQQREQHKPQRAERLRMLSAEASDFAASEREASRSWP